jgi:2-iminobutanoate/2-iminopropanoate deaminase
MKRKFILKTATVILLFNIVACKECCTQSEKTNYMKKIIETKNAPAPIGPYNQAVLLDNTLYISGQIAINPKTGTLDTSSVEIETKQVMENLKAILIEAGMDFSNVVKCSIFISDMNNFGKINEVYGSYFSKDFPARETVQVARLPKDVNVEISAIAAK